IIKSEVLSPKQQMAENTEVLRGLMLQLYTLYPNELAKSTQVGAREMTEWVFDGKANWKFEAIRSLQGKDALTLLFDANYQSDHILPLIVGLETQLFAHYGAKNEFEIPQVINPIQLTQVKCDIQELSKDLMERTLKNKKLLDVFENANSLDAIQRTLHNLTHRLKENTGVSDICQ
ncbi:MAG: hypothetical protein WAX04_05405, partial [Oscillospiraceae bacterium]